MWEDRKGVGDRKLLKFYRTDSCKFPIEKIRVLKISILPIKLEFSGATMLLKKMITGIRTRPFKPRRR